MNFVIPMAGRGERFQKAGYKLPKMMIEAHGKTLLEWSVDSLPLELCTQLVFIALKEMDEQYDLHAFVDSRYEKYSPVFVFLDKPTRGQAETVLKAEPILDPDIDLVIYNIDTYFRSSRVAELLQRPGIDGVLGAFESHENRFSFAKLGDDGFVTEVAEKVAISTNALTGLYHFRSCNDFLNVAEAAISRGEMTKGEYYVAPLYNELIHEGKKFIVDICEEQHVLGTPDELNAFIKNFRPGH